MSFLPLLPIYDVQNATRRRKMCPERLDPLRFYNDTEIYQRLRFIKDDFLYICDLLRPDLQRMTQRSYALTPEQQLTLALRFYATGTFQICVGDTVCGRHTH